MVDGERDDGDNDKYVYFFLMDIAPEIIQGWDGVCSWVVRRYMGCKFLFSRHCYIFLYRLHQDTWGTAQIFQEGFTLKNKQNGLLKV